MELPYVQGDELFDWDPVKAARNYERHGVPFEEAVQVFLDPLRLYLAPEELDGEPRDTVIGWSFKPRLLLVVHTERGATTRIISARVPTAHERKQYTDQQAHT